MLYPGVSQSAPRQNPVDEEQPVVPSHRKFQRPASAYDPVDEEQSAAPFYHKSSAAGVCAYFGG